MISAVTGESPHTVNKMLDEMIGLGPVREVTRMKRNPIYEPTSSCNYFHAAQDKTA